MAVGHDGVAAGLEQAHLPTGRLIQLQSAQEAHGLPLCFCGKRCKMRWGQPMRVGRTCGWTLHPLNTLSGSSGGRQPLSIFRVGQRPPCGELP